MKRIKKLEEGVCHEEKLFAPYIYRKAFKILLTFHVHNHIIPLVCGLKTYFQYEK